MKLLRRKLNLVSPPERKINHLKCMTCHSKACILCIRSIRIQMKENNDHLDDKWYQQVQHAILQDKPPIFFLGHCCEIKQKINECVQRNNPPLKNTEKMVLRYDGYLHFPELGILIPPPILKYVDVHGFGKEDSTDVPGLLLGVIARECA